MAQPASLHPTSTNATTHASSPPPTRYYLARHWCCGAKPRNAMNLFCRKSKIRAKTGLRAWGRRQAQGMTVWLVLPDQRDQGKDRLKMRKGRGGGGAESTCLALLYYGSRSMTPCPYLTTSTPRCIDHFPPFSFFSGGIEL